MAVHAEKHGRPRLEQHWRNHHTAHSFPAPATSSFPFVIQINVEYNICIDSCVFHTRPQFPERRPPVARGATPIQYPRRDRPTLRMQGVETSDDATGAEGWARIGTNIKRNKQSQRATSDEQGERGCVVSGRDHCREGERR
ncbi:hypothetical protein VTO73DRAFT_783 [Trametes versicolor]